MQQESQHTLTIGVQEDMSNKENNKGQGNCPAIFSTDNTDGKISTLSVLKNSI